MTRQLVCLVPSRPSIKATEGNNHKHHRMGRQVPSKKVAMSKPGIPPAKIPEIAMRGRAGMTSKTKKSPRKGRAPSRLAAYVLMNEVRSCKKQHRLTRHHSKIAVKVQTQANQQCRNPGSPSQNPGDRTEKLQGHEAPLLA